MATATLDEVDSESPPPSIPPFQTLTKPPFPAHLRGIISNLYMLIVQAHDYQGQATQQAMTAEM
jgi:hypothetical protein